MMIKAQKKKQTKQRCPIGISKMWCTINCWIYFNMTQIMVIPSRLPKSRNLSRSTIKKDVFRKIAHTNKARCALCDFGSNINCFFFNFHFYGLTYRNEFPYLVEVAIWTYVCSCVVFHLPPSKGTSAKQIKNPSCEGHLRNFS